MTAAKHDSTIVYPFSRTVDQVDTIHGVDVADPYRWLENPTADEVRDWIEAENRLTFDYLAKIPARDQIRARLASLWDFERYGLPRKRSARYFFTRNDGLQNQSVLYWSEAPEAEARPLLDPNQLAADGTVALMDSAVSRDGRLLAYALADAGSDWQVWRVREVESGQDLADELRWVKWSSASWTADGLGFYYSRYDEPDSDEAYSGINFYHKLCYHRLGSSQADDRLIYQRPDFKEWMFHGEVTEDGRYLVITVSHGTHPEQDIYYQELQTGGDVVELLTGFQADHQFLGNDGPLFYFKTDLDAPLYRVIAIDIRNPEPAAWRELIAQGQATLQSVSLVADKLAAVYLVDAYNEVRIFTTAGEFVRRIELPCMGTVLGFDGSRDDGETFYQIAGFTTPETIYRYDVNSGENRLFRRPDVDFDPDDYVTRQVRVRSKDGAQLPLFICHRRDLKLDGQTPTYLYGYGGFNIPLTPAFSASKLVWMERGGIYAHAILRGGGEYGAEWHMAGAKLEKQNVFDDFIAAAEWLIDSGYTTTPRLAIGGRSNGGLLVGACMTQRPDLFGVCLPGVGVLDMLRFHKFTIGWAWVSDYGSPDDPAEFAALLAYSPLHNVKPGVSYPPTLITTGDHDDRVYPAHSFKFAAALQAAQAGPAPILIRIDTQAGHGAGKPTAKLIDEEADGWAFVEQMMRM